LGKVFYITILYVFGRVVNVKRWEYKIHDIGFLKREKHLNELGMEGWELVAVSMNRLCP